MATSPSNRNYSFSATVDAWVANSKKRCDAVFRQSIQEVINDAQTPIAKGGRMRVDTGFMRASGKLSFSGMPSGPARGEKGQAYNWDDTIAADLATAEPGATLYFGWTANYTKYREAYDGFLIAAIQKWPQIVEKYARRLQSMSAFSQLPKE